MQPQLTVIIPVYNGMPFLKEAVESILSQTYPNFSLLIINDGSTDGSTEYFNSLFEPRIKVIHQENIGLCCSLNKAVFEHTESELIARLDQDDISLPSRLEEQVNFMVQNPNYAAVLCQLTRIGADGRDFGYYQTPSKELIQDYDPSCGIVAHSTILFRREKFIELGGYRQELYPVDDLDLSLRFCENAPVAVITKPLVKYRIHGNASTFQVFWLMETKNRYVFEMSHRRKEGQAEIPFDEWVKLDTPPPVQQFIRYIKGVGRLFFREAGKLIGEGKKWEGGLYLIIAFCAYPSFVQRKLFALRQGNK